MLARCGKCNEGYRVVNKACKAWGGICSNGALIAQTSRTQDNHCGVCDKGYYLDSKTKACTRGSGH